MHKPSKQKPSRKLWTQFGMKRSPCTFLARLLLVSLRSFAGQLEPSSTITINLYDKDLIGQDFLGIVTIPMSKLLLVDGDSIQEWFPIDKEPTKNYNKGLKNPGFIEIKLHYPKVCHLVFLLWLTFFRKPVYLEVELFEEKTQRNFTDSRKLWELVLLEKSN